MPKLAKRFNLKFRPKVPKKQNGQNPGDFITEHSHTRHKNDPTRTSTRNRTQYGENVDVEKVKQKTMNDPDVVEKLYDKDGNHYATRYKKEFRENLSTPDTPTRHSRVIINNVDPSRSTQFPFFK